MKFVKLGLISVVVIYVIIWAFTLAFPSRTIVSRAANVAVLKDTIINSIINNKVPTDKWFSYDDASVNISISEKTIFDKPFVNYSDVEYDADTLYLTFNHNNETFLKGGLGVYQLSPDSATVQLFYVFTSDWYKPWEKIAQIVYDAKYGGQMEASLNLLKGELQKQ